MARQTSVPPETKDQQGEANLQEGGEEGHNNLERAAPASVSRAEGGCDLPGCLGTTTILIFRW